MGHKGGVVGTPRALGSRGQEESGGSWGDHSSMPTLLLRLVVSASHSEWSWLLHVCTWRPSLPAVSLPRQLGVSVVLSQCQAAGFYGSCLTLQTPAPWQNSAFSLPSVCLEGFYWLFYLADFCPCVCSLLCLRPGQLSSAQLLAHRSWGEQLRVACSWLDALLLPTSSPPLLFLVRNWPVPNFWRIPSDGLILR